MAWYARYVDAFDYIEKIKAKSKIDGKILPFMQLTSPVQFDKLLEGMQYFTEQKKYLLK